VIGWQLGVYAACQRNKNTETVLRSLFCPRTNEKASHIITLFYQHELDKEHND